MQRPPHAAPPQNDAAYISSDGGRVCRPLIICDAGAPRVRSEHIAKLKAGEWGFQDFLSRGEAGRGALSGVQGWGGCGTCMHACMRWAKLKRSGGGAERRKAIDVRRGGQHPGPNQHTAHRVTRQAWWSTWTSTRRAPRWSRCTPTSASQT